MIAKHARTGEWVVLADDGSDAAQSALPLANALASQLGVDLALFYVSGVAEAPPRAVVAHALEANGELRVATGDAATEIVRASEAETTALLILTTHGRERESDGRLGHVTEQVVARASRPVLIVRPEAELSPARPPLHRLLAPVDGARATARSLQPVFTLARRLHATIDVLAVVPDAPATAEHGGMHLPRYVDQPQYEWGSWRGEALRRLAADIPALAQSLPVAIHVAHGSVGDAIIRYAGRHAVDAIVLVRRSRLQPGRARVLRLLLARTPSPILLVGATEQEEAAAEVEGHGR